MNYIRHLNAFFFQHVKHDKRLTANHVSLYLSLFQFWNCNRFQNPFYIKREDVMSINGIGSRNTYMKCMKELHQFGYIFYVPGTNKFQKSKVHIAKLEDKKDPLLKQLELFEPKHPANDGDDKGDITSSKPGPVNPTGTGPNVVTYVAQNRAGTGPKYEPGTGSNMSLLIKHKLINEREKEKALPPAEKIFLKNEITATAVSRPGTEKIFTRPEITQVLSFFKKNNYADLEAKKFFNHYQANGWLVGGTTPMNDWPSSAHKWMLNVEKFESRAHQKVQQAFSAKTNYTNEKNFFEPL